MQAVKVVLIDAINLIVQLFRNWIESDLKIYSSSNRFNSFFFHRPFFIESYPDR